MTRALCFVEFEDEIKVILHQVRERSEATLVPLTERVRGQAYRTGLRVVPVEDLLTKRTHLRALVAGERYLTWAAARLDPKRLTQAGCATAKHHLRFLLHYSMLLTDLVVTAAAADPDAELIAVKHPFRPSGTGEISFGHQRILWRIVQAMGEARHRAVRLFDGTGRSTKAPRVAGTVHRALLTTVNRTLLSLWGRRRLVLVPGLGYGMGHFANVLGHNGADVVLAREGGWDGARSLGGAIISLLRVVLPIPSRFAAWRGVSGVLSVPTSGRLDEEWQRLGDRLLTHGISFRGVNLMDAVREKLIADILPVAGRAAELVRAYEGLFRTIRPVAIVSQMGRWGNGLALGEAGTHSGIRTLVISHGSHVVPKNRTETIAHSDHADGLLYSSAYDLAAAQSPFAEQALSRLAPATGYVRCEPVMWGYRSLPTSPNRVSEPVILHAGTPKPRWAWRPWWYETTEEYIAALIHLIRSVDRLGLARLIIRCRPLAECTLKDLRARLPQSSRVTVKSEGNFLDDLAAADLLVSFSSTTMEEALRARRPVLQFGGGGRYRHLPGLVWGEKPPQRAAVYSVTTPVDLDPALRWILSEHAGRPLTDEDLRDYLFKPGDALSADELAECLLHPDRLNARVVHSGRAPAGVNATAVARC